MQTKRLCRRCAGINMSQVTLERKDHTNLQVLRHRPFEVGFSVSIGYGSMYLVCSNLDLDWICVDSWRPSGPATFRELANVATSNVAPVLEIRI